MSENRSVFKRFQTARQIGVHKFLSSSVNEHKNYQPIPFINVNIKMYIFDHLRMYIFAIPPLDRYIFSIDKIFQ